MSNQVHIDLPEQGIMIIRLGTPDEKAVVLTRDRLASLNEAIDKARKERPRGVIIAGCREDMFTVGADINVINTVSDAKVGETLAREGQLAFQAIADLPCPVVAAISGPCVGGGCELVLACSSRIISDHKSSIIGLPETKLGILPGFGGTQRLPRLIGLPAALDIMLGGKTLPSNKAYKLGLVDKIVSFDQLIKSAIDTITISKGLIGRKLSFKNRLLTYNSIGRKIVQNKVTSEVIKKTRGFYPALPATIDSSLYGLSKGMTKGLDNEAKELGRLIVTPECKSLVKIFFLTESSKALGKSGKKEADAISGIVVGAGVMGSGIAYSIARAGSPVIIKDTSEESLSKGLAHIKQTLDKSRSMSESEKSFTLNRIELTAKDSANVSNSNFVIEAVFEDLALKQKILGELASQVAAGAIIATNTSSLSVSKIAEGIENPSRVVGMHFFNPVEKMPLVEIIRGDHTSDRTLSVVAALAVRLGKFPIIVNDVPGFLVNRILTPYLNEAAFLIEEGISIKQIDRAAVNFGMPMGPVRLLDEVGLDVAAHVSEIMVRGYGERMNAPQFAKKLSTQGLKGKKSGHGFYIHNGNSSEPNSELPQLLALKNESKELSEISINERLIMSLINEAVKCLDEGVAGQPGPDAANQINLGTVMGMGFPPFRGGIIHYANSIGSKIIFDKLSKLEKEIGVRFKPADGIVSRAKQNTSF